MKSILIILFICLFIPLNAQVSQSLSGADSLSIGSSFELRINTDFPLRELAIPDTLQQFQILSQNIQDLPEGSKAILRIMVLDVGALTFPKLELIPQDSTMPQSSTDAFRIHVLQTRADADTLLRDLKPLHRYRGQLPFWLYLLLGLICMILTAILIYKALHKPPKLKPAPLAKPLSPPQKIPPWKIALDKLIKLRESDLISRDIVSYHFRLSYILREYLEAQYHFNALEMTSSEIAGVLPSLQVADAEELIGILRYCDQVKFAGSQSSYEQILLHSQALQLCLMRQGERSGL